MFLHDHRHNPCKKPWEENQPATGLLEEPPRKTRTKVRQGCLDQAVQSVHSLHSDDMITEGESWGKRFSSFSVRCECPLTLALPGGLLFFLKTQFNDWLPSLWSLPPRTKDRISHSLPRENIVCFHLLVQCSPVFPTRQQTPPLFVMSCFSMYYRL